MCQLTRLLCNYKYLSPTKCSAVFFYLIKHACSFQKCTFHWIKRWQVIYTNCNRNISRMTVSQRRRQTTEIRWFLSKPVCNSAFKTLHCMINLSACMHTNVDVCVCVYVCMIRMQIVLPTGSATMCTTLLSNKLKLQRWTHILSYDEPLSAFKYLSWFVTHTQIWVLSVQTELQNHTHFTFNILCPLLQGLQWRGPHLLRTRMPIIPHQTSSMIQSTGTATKPTMWVGFLTLKSTNWHFGDRFCTHRRYLRFLWITNL